MSRLSPKSTKKIDLGNDEWIEVRTSMSFEELADVVSGVMDVGTKTTKEQLDGVLALAERAVVGWRLLDDEGAEVPYDVTRLKELDFRTMMLLQESIQGLYTPEKKD